MNEAPPVPVVPAPIGVKIESSFVEGLRQVKAGDFSGVSASGFKVTFGTNPSFAPGNVFIFNDLAYKVSAVDGGPSGPVTITTTRPSLDEVFATLKIEGEITLDPEKASPAPPPSEFVSGRAVPPPPRLLATVSDSDTLKPPAITTEFSTVRDSSGTLGSKFSIKYSVERGDSTNSIGGSVSAYTQKMRIRFDCGITCGKVPLVNDFYYSGKIEPELSMDFKVSTATAYPAIETLMYNLGPVLVPATGFTVGFNVPFYLATGVSGEIGISGKLKGAWSVSASKTGEAAPEFTLSQQMIPSVENSNPFSASGELTYGIAIVPKPLIAVLGITISQLAAKTGADFSATASQGLTDGKPNGNVCYAAEVKGVAESTFTLKRFLVPDYIAKFDLFALLGLDPVLLPRIEINPTCNSTSTGAPAPAPAPPPPAQGGCKFTGLRREGRDIYPVTENCQQPLFSLLISSTTTFDDGTTRSFSGTFEDYPQFGLHGDRSYQITTWTVTAISGSAIVGGQRVKFPFSASLTATFNTYPPNTCANFC